MDAIVQVLPLRGAGTKAPTAVPLGSAGLVAHRHVNVTPTHNVAKSVGSHRSGYLVALLMLAAGTALIPFARRRRLMPAHRRDRHDSTDLGA
jgi:hypothetical protein